MPPTRGAKNNPFPPEQRAAIAKRLQLVRRGMQQGRGLLQAEMAELVDVSHSHYSKCESGHNTFSRRFLARFADRTGISLAWLTTGQGPMHPTSPNRAPGPAPAPPLPISEQTVQTILAAALDPQVIAAAQALAQATNTPYDQAIALVIARKLTAME
jgi:transcriptional regulator with XRE-family HTH domain